MMDDLISRQAAIDEVNSETVSTNPEHFKSSEKFIKFMDDDDIASFGKWQWANGFNTALTATTIQLKNLPSAQPSEIQDILEYLDTVLHPIISPDHWNVYSELYDMVSMLPSAQPEITEDQLKEYCERRCLVVITSDLYARMQKSFSQSEVIHCRECQHFINHRCYEQEHIRIGLFTHDTEFCFWAERRDNG